MNTNQELLPGLQASFDAAVDFQEQPLTVSGNADLITELHEAAEVHVRELQKHKVSTHLPKAVVPAPAAATEVLEGRRATVAAKLFDLANGDDVYAELHARRVAEKRLAIRKRLGLVAHDRCAKHEKALAAVGGR